MTSGENTPEGQARTHIDKMLEQNGWKEMEDGKSGTGYVEEVETLRGKFADYVLYINGTPIAIVEAKKQSINPLNKRDQPRTYSKNLEKSNKYMSKYSVPFTYTTNGDTIIFEDVRSGVGDFREVYTFHTPENLSRLLEKDYDSIRDKMRVLSSEDIDKGLWDHQAAAFDSGMEFISQGKRRLYYQMATGSGKTRLGIALSYALLQSGFADRILFAVDTDQLRTDTRKDYKGYEPIGTDPFSDNYIVGGVDEHEKKNHGCDVVVTTTQKLSRRLHEENHGYTVGEFDVVIADEAHRGVFNDEGLAIALDYFDAVEIGLTATPHQTTDERYNGNVAYEYDYNNALKDEKVVPYRCFSVDTQIMAEDGIRHNGKWYSPDKIGDDIIVRDTQEKVAEALLDNTNVKDELTLVFAYNRKHAQVIVDDLREIYGDLFEDPYEEIKRVTGGDYEPDVTLAEFKQPFRPPHIIVTVDMVTTGVDIRPLNNIVLLRPVKSKVLFNQMMGRGTRTHETKDHFKIFDCVSAFEYHDGVPPFATGEIQYDTSTSSTDTTPEPSEEPEIVEESDIDEVIRNCKVYPSKQNEWVEEAKFVEEIQLFIRENSDKITRATKHLTSVEDIDNEIQSILLEEWKHYDKETVLDAFDVDSLFMLCVRTIEGYEALRSKANDARRKTILEYELTGVQEEIMEDVSHRAIIEQGGISQNNFYNPPLSSKWGINTAKSEFDDLDAVLDTFNRYFLSIDGE